MTALQQWGIGGAFLLAGYFAAYTLRPQEIKRVAVPLVPDHRATGTPAGNSGHAEGEGGPSSPGTNREESGNPRLESDRGSAAVPSLPTPQHMSLRRGAAVVSMQVRPESIRPRIKPVYPEGMEELLAERRQGLANRIQEGILSTHRKFVEVQRRFREQLGPEPWASDSFHYFCDPKANVHAIGGDYCVPASPEDTVRWIASLSGFHPSEQQMSAAVARVEEYEGQRKVMWARIADEVIRRAAQGQEREPVEAYMLMGNRLFLLRKGDCQELEDLRGEHEVEMIRILDRAKDIVR